MISLQPSQIGRGWRPVVKDEPVKTLDQWLDLSQNRPVWSIGFYFTHEDKKATEHTTYRRPTTLWTVFLASLRLPSKFWARFNAWKSNQVY